MMKIAFKCFYDILDKIALFLNEYLRIGMDKFKLYYSNIWYKNFNNKIIWPIILETNSFSLNALFNLHMDLLDGPFITLRKIRNRLTHGIVNIRMFQEKETYADMKDETLFNHSMELAKIVRSAILYLLMFVYNQEEKKERELNKISVTQIVPDLPDHLKSSR
ncbi:MAG: hypothetical protein A2V67_15090 [Deltaproteobacteria bacterium RBG_13_61_14]|nr:MAG: hypothetical protein A2V67_15090 [Deltaproteobacteria bacterium RBG_13_61_14]